MKCKGIGALAVRRTRLSSPFPSSSLAGVQERAGLGQVVLSNTKPVWCYSKQSLRTLCCCLDVLALLSPGMFRNTVLLWSVWEPMCWIFCNLLLLWWFKVFSTILEKTVLGWVLHGALPDFYYLNEDYNFEHDDKTGSECEFFSIFFNACWACSLYTFLVSPPPSLYF